MFTILDSFSCQPSIDGTGWSATNDAAQQWIQTGPCHRRGLLSLSVGRRPAKITTSIRFTGPQSLFIDIMMNIRLLFRAHQLGAGEELFRKAVTHARTTEKYLVRKHGERMMDREGSVITKAFQSVRGEFRNLSTQQGYSPFTCWARGLAWAIYGFTDTFLFTGEHLFLGDCGKMCGILSGKHAREWSPVLDYGAPSIPNEPVDSSAAAIVAGAFWKLKSVEGTGRASSSYRGAALAILDSLTGDDFWETTIHSMKESCDMVFIIGR
jgi:unsaturated chondroitin disaccharide hydrolase